MKTRFCFLLLAGIGFSNFQKLQAQPDLVTPALPSIPNRTFSITAYGAMGDNATDNTAAIQNAINTAKDKTARRTRMIALKECDKILIENVTLMNSPMFHIAISGKSSNVTVSGVIVRAPASDDPVNPSHNTDACDVAGKDILIKDCDI